MFMLPPSTRVFLCTMPTDMRRSFDGLAAMTRDLVIQNPLSGHLFVFRNRNGDRLKVLYWDRAGFCLLYKRLEQGTFRFPLAPVVTRAVGQTASASSKPEPASLEVDGGELAMILEGIELEHAHRRKRFSLPPTAAPVP